jgi:hypothetical protein
MRECALDRTERLRRGSRSGLQRDDLFFGIVKMEKADAIVGKRLGFVKDDSCQRL